MVSLLVEIRIRFSEPGKEEIWLNMRLKTKIWTWISRIAD